MNTLVAVSLIICAALSANESVRAFKRAADLNTDNWVFEATASGIFAFLAVSLAVLAVATLAGDTTL